mgnify:CR=1 FL=1
MRPLGRLQFLAIIQAAAGDINTAFLKPDLIALTQDETKCTLLKFQRTLDFEAF